MALGGGGNAPFPPACGKGEAASALLDRLNTIPVRLAIIEAFEADRLDDGVAELVLVDFGDGEPLVLEESDELGFVGLDLARRPGSRLLRHVGEDLAVLLAQLLPERAGDDRIEVINDVSGQH